MIRPSPELVAVVRRWNAALERRDEAALDNMLSMSEHLRYQGTADDEYWAGRLFKQGFADHQREVPVYDWEELGLEAFENGDTGWAHCRARLRFRHSGKVFDARFSHVLAVENGQWKIVLTHVSVPTPNEKVSGIEHAVLNDLVEAAREGFRLDQREGMASVMFTDIANSSAIAETLGDRIWAAAVGDHFERVAGVIAAQGGQLVKSLGDGTMSSFPSARAALDAAIEIQRQNAAVETEPPLALRIGIHTGDVIQTRDDFFGTVVNKSARVAAIAEPDEIRLSEATRLMAGSARGFRFGNPITLHLRGLDGDHLVHRLEWRE
ncbi:nuclear transport factor 2 family protein [Seohaeicola saemankumensis]|nr:adenylate/guanylate cyclase domain-containing protein [Seohaeicola saemankumensis]MCA0869571.1 nuclear transport factor 2 family protein [Seohaeicola saemankumensis]